MGLNLALDLSHQMVYAENQLQTSSSQFMSSRKFIIAAALKSMTVDITALINQKKT